ncbi:MAG: hypothetical protein NUV98_00910 [Candidatus Roizmanbacteria bacterium]|nr:hypothetical protein [Candidatus Roizmanbacteria bacterium]
MPMSIELNAVGYTYRVMYRCRGRPNACDKDGLAVSQALATEQVSVYPLLLPDGSYAGLVVPRKTQSLPEGMKIRADFGRIYYPPSGTSAYSFWVEGQPEDSAASRFREIHVCYSGRERGERVIDCPDWGKS